MPVTAEYEKEKLKVDILRHRALRDLSDLDYKRSIKRAEGSGALSQVEIAESLGITQPSVSYTIKKARDVAEPRSGFSGATPFEICQRYAISEIDKKQAIDELSHWDYAATAGTDGFDALIADPDGTFAEVERAAIMGLIDDDIYAAVVSRLGEMA